MSTLKFRHSTIKSQEFLFSTKENNRRLSVKEIARIQTFPDWFYFSKGFSKKSNNAKLDLIYKQIGNAVPVMLGYHVGKAVIQAYLNASEEDEKN